MARVVVTGGAGFLGSHLCESLLARGDEVVAIDNLLTGSIDNISHLFGQKGFVFVEQGCRFLKPIVVGDNIRPRQIVERIWAEGTRVFCRVKTLLLNQRDEVVLECFHLYRVLSKEAA